MKKVEPAILVKNLTKRYRKVKENAVDKISFEVGQGEFFSLLGPNGAGKTTTISILTTTLSKTSGDVSIAGHDIEREQNKIREKIGVIFQNPSLDLNLTAEENVRFHVVLYGLYNFRPSYSMMDEQYKRRVDELAEVLDLKNEIFKPVKSFSGGMKRKLEIIRSLMHHPKVLFLDEPTSGLDPASRKSLWEYLCHVRETEKTTMFLTTHYLEEAEDADRICIINDGNIVSLGTPSKIKKDLIEKYLILKSKQVKKLVSEIEKMKLKYERISDDGYKVYLNGNNPQKVIQSIESPLSYLDIHNPTLEDAYLKIISDQK